MAATLFPYDLKALVSVLYRVSHISKTLNTLGPGQLPSQTAEWIKVILWKEQFCVTRLIPAIEKYCLPLLPFFFFYTFPFLQFFLHAVMFSQP